MRSVESGVATEQTLVGRSSSIQSVQTPRRQRGKEERSPWKLIDRVLLQRLIIRHCPQLSKSYTGREFDLHEDHSHTDQMYAREDSAHVAF